MSFFLRLSNLSMVAVTVQLALSVCAAQVQDYRVQPRAKFIPLSQFQGNFVASDDRSQKIKCSAFQAGEQVVVHLDLSEQTDNSHGEEYFPYNTLTVSSGTWQKISMILPEPKKGSEDSAGIWLDSDGTEGQIAGYRSPYQVESMSVALECLVSGSCKSDGLAGIINDATSCYRYSGQVMELSKDKKTLRVYTVSQYDRWALLRRPRSFKKDTVEICEFKRQ